MAPSFPAERKWTSCPPLFFPLFFLRFSFQCLHKKAEAGPSVRALAFLLLFLFLVCVECGDVKTTLVQQTVYPIQVRF